MPGFCCNVVAGGIVEEAPGTGPPLHEYLPCTNHVIHGIKYCKIQGEVYMSGSTPKVRKNGHQISFRCSLYNIFLNEHEPKDGYSIDFCQVVHAS